MVADVVRNVGGERVEVRSLMGPGTDPHLYTPTRSDLVALSGADLIFYSGLLLEGRMTDILEKMTTKKPVVAVTRNFPAEHVINVEGHHPDPHVWMDVAGWTFAAKEIAATLSAHDAAGAEIYQKNLAGYSEQLKALDEYAKKSFSTIPSAQRQLVTAHDAFTYMGRAYGIQVHGIQGISTESEAGLKDVNRLVDLLVEKKIPAVFVESSVAEKNVRALIEGSKSRGHAVAIGGQLFSDAMGAGGTYEGTYIGMIDHNTTMIVRALGGQAPERGLNGKLGAAK